MTEDEIGAELDRIAELVDSALRAYQDQNLKPRAKVARMRLIKKDAVACTLQSDPMSNRSDKKEVIVARRRAHKRSHKLAERTEFGTNKIVSFK